MPASLWRDFTHDALAGHPALQFPPASLNPGDSLNARQWPGAPDPAASSLPSQLGDKTGDGAGDGAGDSKAAARAAAEKKKAIQDKTRPTPPKILPSAAPSN